jgi:hypothetical protein
VRRLEPASEFPLASSRTRRASFPAPGSPVIASGGRGWPPEVDVLVAGPPDDKGFAASLGHELYPRGSLGPAASVEVGELADVMNFDVLLSFTDLTAAGQNSAGRVGVES